MAKKKFDRIVGESELEIMKNTHRPNLLISEIK